MKLNLWYLLRRTVRRPRTLAGVFLLPAAVLLTVLFLPSEGLDQPPVVGLCLPETPTQVADTLRDLLLDWQGDYLQIQTARPEEAREKVASGAWDCAFVLDGSFDAALDGGTPVRQMISPSSVLAGPAREAVAAALFQLRAAQLARAYLTDSGLLEEGDSEQAAALLSDRLDIVPMAIQRETSGTGPQPLPRHIAAPLIHGFIGLVLFLQALLAGGELHRLHHSLWYRRTLPVAGPIRLDLPLLLVQGLLAVLPAALSLAVAIWRLPGFGSLGWELALLVLYQVLLVPLTLAASRLPGMEDLMPLLLPYLAVACVLLCPILFDAGRLIPALYPFSRLLPPTWYLLGAAGEWVPLALAALLLWSGALILPGALALGRSRARG